MNRINFPFRELPLSLRLTLTEFADKYNLDIDGITMCLDSVFTGEVSKLIELMKDDVGITMYLKEDVDRVCKEITAYCAGVGLGLKRLSDVDPYTLGELDQYMLGEIPSQFADWIMINNSTIAINGLVAVSLNGISNLRIATEGTPIPHSTISLGEIKTSTNIVSVGTERSKTLDELDGYALNELDEQPITFFVFGGVPLIVTTS